MTSQVLDYDPLPEPMSITRIRAGHAAVVSPQHARSDAIMKLVGRGGKDWDHEAVTMLTTADGSVSLTCGCHEPVIDGDLILGFRPA